MAAPALAAPLKVLVLGDGHESEVDGPDPNDDWLAAHPKALRALRAIARYQQIHLWMPSQRDLLPLSGIRSTAHMRWVMQELQRHGYVHLGEGARQVAITDVGWDAITARELEVLA